MDNGSWSYEFYVETSDNRNETNALQGRFEIEGWVDFKWFCSILESSPLVISYYVHVERKIVKKWKRE